MTVGNYLKITVEVCRLDLAEDGLIATDRRIYPAEFAATESYHSFLTYETLEMLNNIRTNIKDSHDRTTDHATQHRPALRRIPRRQP